MEPLQGAPDERFRVGQAEFPAKRSASRDLSQYWHEAPDSPAGFRGFKHTLEPRLRLFEHRVEHRLGEPSRIRVVS